jgi:hypothetical protein
MNSGEYSGFKNSLKSRKVNLVFASDKIINENRKN